MKQSNLYKKIVYKNNLSELMHIRNVNASDLAMATGICRSTIYRIKNNKFNKTTKTITNKICDVLEISVDEFKTPTSYKQMIQEKLREASFIPSNILMLQKILLRLTGTKFKIESYNSGYSINIDSKCIRKNNFSGNVRLTIEDNEIAFKVIDFDFIYFDKEFFNDIVLGFEKYAKRIGVKYVIFSHGVLYNTYHLVRTPIKALLDNKYGYYNDDLQNILLVDYNEVYERFENNTDRIYKFAKKVCWSLKNLINNNYNLFLYDEYWENKDPK